MQYLTRQQILLIHSLLIDETGGRHGVRDVAAIAALESAAKQKVFDRELYSTVLKKAALYARNIIQHHPFVDGSKRTGMTVASVFLEISGYSVIAEVGEIEKFALLIVQEKLKIDAIARWFKDHSSKI